jgi:hypothetical protein
VKRFTQEGTFLSLWPHWVRPWVSLLVEDGPERGEDAPFEAWLSYVYLPVVLRTQLKLPSIGSERKAYFPNRPRFFDPGVCSRSGWTVSSRDIVFMVRSEHRPNSFERLA